MTRISTSAKRTNITPISAVMERATAVSTGPRPSPTSPAWPARPSTAGFRGEGKEASFPGLLWNSENQIQLALGDVNSLS